MLCHHPHKQVCWHSRTWLYFTSNWNSAWVRPSNVFSPLGFCRSTLTLWIDHGVGFTSKCNNTKQPPRYIKKSPVTYRDVTCVDNAIEWTVLRAQGWKENQSETGHNLSAWAFKHNSWKVFNPLQPPPSGHPKAFIWN